MEKIAEEQIPANKLLNQIIDSLIEKRVFGVAYQKTIETTEYDSWAIESNSLSDDIIEIMGTDRNLFYRYEELSSAREGEFLKSTYAQGLRDGVELLRALLYEGKR